MELRIKITRENAERVAQLIKELAQLETGEILVTGVESKTPSLDLEMLITGTKSKTTGPYLPRPLPSDLAPPPELVGLNEGRPYLETTAAKQVGTWGQFNSFFPVKGVLRILCHMINEHGGKAANLQELVDKSKNTFKIAGLGRYRGFPSSNKESAVGRLVWHFITPAHEMGLVKLEGAKEIPARGWGKVAISPTKEGLEFAKLKNPIFDEGGTTQVLSEAEQEWMTNHLKKIDAAGYREYSFIREIFEEFKKGNTDMAAWLKNNGRFINYVKSWPKKKDEKTFRKQMTNVAAMFAQSKIALLRELGVISNKRNEYTVIGDLD